MVLGLDYYNTITEQPDLFRGLTELMHDLGVKVYIVSAVGRKTDPANLSRYIESMHEFITTHNIVVDGVHALEFDEPREIPEIKRSKCAELGITHYFDDRNDVCTWLTENGIKGYRVKK